MFSDCLRQGLVTHHPSEFWFELKGKQSINTLGNCMITVNRNEMVKTDVPHDKICYCPFFILIVWPIRGIRHYKLLLHSYLFIYLGLSLNTEHFQVQIFKFNISSSGTVNNSRTLFYCGGLQVNQLCWC
jgi:hypothetical protein